MGNDEINLNVYNFRDWRGSPKRDFDVIRFDSNNDCNIQCVYCHNSRSKDTIDFGEFRTFLEQSVGSVSLFQFGCRMEPTLDERLCTFMQSVADSPARPRTTFRLQTNAILLHRHDHGRMREAGLNVLTVSIDTVDPLVFKQLRGGASLAKVYRNIEQFHQSCPAVKIAFVTTVTSANIGSMDALVESGLDAGATVFNLRQMMHHPSNKIVDHTLMRELAVSDAQFAEMTQRVRAKFAHQARFFCLGAQSIKEAGDAVVKRSASPSNQTVSLRMSANKTQGE